VAPIKKAKKKRGKILKGQSPVISSPPQDTKVPFIALLPWLLASTSTHSVKVLQMQSVVKPNQPFIYTLGPCIPRLKLLFLFDDGG
jgi:hypothetical protein